jgi:hypothetical protein
LVGSVKKSGSAPVIEYCAYASSYSQVVMSAASEVINLH